MRASRRPSSALGTIVSGAAALVVGLSACQGIVGIQDLRFVDAGGAADAADAALDARDAADAATEGSVNGCAPAEIGGACVETCQCPIEATCMLEQSDSPTRTCCRHLMADAGETCNTNCDCASGRCSLEDNTCH